MTNRAGDPMVWLTACGLAGAVLAVLVGTGCRIDNDDERRWASPTSGPTDAPNDPPEPAPTPVFLPPATPLAWHDTSELDYVRVQSRLAGTLVPSDTLTAQRVQAWMDEVHARVVASAPDSFGIVPKPHVVLVSSPETTATSTAIPVCLDMPVVFDAEPAGGDPGDFVVLGPYAAEHTLPPATTPCASGPRATDVATFASWMNGRGGTCTYQVQGGELHVSGQGCVTPGFRQAARGGYLAMSSAITVTTGLITVSDEDMTVATLTRELARYYRALDLATAGYGFFFEQTEIPSVGTPTPVADSDALVAAGDYLDMFLEPFPLPEVPGAALNPRLLVVLGGVAYDLISLACDGDPASCDTSCAEATDLIYFSPTLYRAWGSFATPDELSALDTSMTACAAKISIADVSGAGALSVDDLLYLFGVLWDRLPNQASPIESPATLQDALTQVGANFTALATHQDAFFQAITARHLGFYTTGQEADRLGLALADLVGVSSQASIDALFGDASFLEEIDPDYFKATSGISMSECAERYEAYWQDADGTYEFIDLGSLGASSHGYCYRIFDLDRETLAHGYGVVDRWVPPGAETWTDIQAEVDAIDFPPEVPR